MVPMPPGDADRRTLAGGTVLRCVVGEFCARQQLIPGIGVLLDEASQEIPQRTVSDFGLTVGLRVESGREFERSPHQSPEGLPETASEANVAIGDDALRYSM